MTLLEIIESYMQEKNEVALTPPAAAKFRYEVKQLKLDKINPSRLIGLARIKKELTAQNLPFTIESKIKRIAGERVTVWIIKRQHENVESVQNIVEVVPDNVDIKHKFVGKEYLNGKELYEMVETDKPYVCWLQQTIEQLQDELNQYQHEKEMQQQAESNNMFSFPFQPASEIITPTPTPATETLEPQYKYDIRSIAQTGIEAVSMYHFVEKLLEESPQLKEHIKLIKFNYHMNQIGYDEFMERWNASTH